MKETSLEYAGRARPGGSHYVESGRNGRCPEDAAVRPITVCLILTGFEEVNHEAVVIVEDPSTARYDSIISIVMVMEFRKTELPQSETLESLLRYCLALQPEWGDKRYKKYCGGYEYQICCISRASDLHWMNLAD